VLSHRVVIDEHLLLEAIRDVHEVGEPADAANVSVALGATADDGGYWDVTTVADDLAELESLGKLEHAPRLVPLVDEARPHGAARRRRCAAATRRHHR
jgi:hypothetical protein